MSTPVIETPAITPATLREQAQSACVAVETGAASAAARFQETIKQLRELLHQKLGLDLPADFPPALPLVVDGIAFTLGQSSSVDTYLSGHTYLAVAAKCSGCDNLLYQRVDTLAQLGALLPHLDCPEARESPFMDKWNHDHTVSTLSPADRLALALAAVMEREGFVRAQ